MCSFLRLLCNGNRESNKQKDFEGATISLDLSLQTKDFAVRIIHAGGREELYQGPVPAYLLLEKYPGMCVARPQIFKYPHESLLGPEELLLPGQKYYLIPSTTAQKLKRKHPKIKEKETAEGKEDESEEKMLTYMDGNDLEGSVCSAKDFYISREKWSKCLLRQCRREKKKPFVPPLPGARISGGSGWEPSLNSVQELSP